MTINKSTEISQMPLVSFVVLTYNHAKFAIDMLEGVYSQTYPNIEIIISDDASQDGTYKIVQQYVENHLTDKTIILNCNEKNMGFIPHFNYIHNNYVHGEIVCLAAGDDVSMPNRVLDTVNCFMKNSQVFAVTGQADIIDEDGNVTSRFENLHAGIYALDDSYIRTSSFMCGGIGLAIRRGVWNRFGSLLDQCPTEDSTLRFRALLLGKIEVSPNMFIKYRIHGNNMSRPSNIYNLKTRGIVTQYRHDLDIALQQSLQPVNILKKLKRKIQLYYYYRQLSYIQSQIRNKYIRYPFKLLQKIVNKKIKNI